MNTFFSSILLAIIALHSASATSQLAIDYTPALTPQEIDKAWFKPELIENENPQLCNALLKKGERIFFSRNQTMDIDLEQLPNGAQTIWQHWGDAQDSSLLKLNNKPINIGANCSGSGSDNEGCTIWVADHKPEEQKIYNLPEAQKIATSHNIKLLKSNESHYELVNANLPAIYFLNWQNNWKNANDDSSLIEAYAITDDLTWKRICGVNLKPRKSELLKAAGIDEAMASLEKIYSAAAQVTSGSGGVTHGHYTFMFMDKILYRPWSLRRKSGTLTEIHPAIIEWGFQGVSEFQKLRDYQQQLEQSSKVIAQFYVRNYGWDAEKSYRMARTAILGALDVDNKFGGYTGFFSENETALRKAILEHRPLAEIKTITADIPTISVDFAVTYPEALSYILERGANPDQQNDFGKTALMYAAQYNQLESIQILLKKGANPNLFTTINGAGLKRSGMTALHYSTRYASAATIRALLSAGAFPLARTSETENFLPIDWLHIYTSKAAKESNGFIAENELPELESLLHAPTEDERKKKAFSYIMQGEKEFQTNHNKTAAYNNFKFALSLEPKNERALNDFSLLSITLEKWGEALEASQFIIETSTNNDSKANAYYNYSLACQAYINEYGYSHAEYNGKNYCTEGILNSLLQSYQLKPSIAKATKIKALFKENPIKVCTYPNKEAPELQVAFRCEKQASACIFAKKDKKPDYKNTFWLRNCTGCDESAKTIQRYQYAKFSIAPQKTYDLGDYQLTTYNLQQPLSNMDNEHFGGDFFINGQICDRDNVRIPDNHHDDLYKLSSATENGFQLPREKLLANPAADNHFFYVNRFGELRLQTITGNIYIKLPDNSYVKAQRGDAILAPAKIYLPKGSTFASGEEALSADTEHDHLLTIIDAKEFIKNNEAYIGDSASLNNGMFVNTKAAKGTQ